MPEISKNTDKVLTNLQSLSHHRLEEINPKLSRYLRSIKHQSPNLAIPLGFIEQLIQSIREPKLIAQIEIVEGKISLSKLSQIPLGIGTQIEAIQTTIDKYKTTHKAIELTVDPNLGEWLPKSDNYEALKVDIAENGQREPIRYWQYQGKNIIIDGCDRAEICRELNLPVFTVEEYYARYEDALDARVKAHINRRHLGATAQAYLIGSIYVSSLECNQQNANVAEEMAQTYGKTSTTIRNYGNLYRNIVRVCDRLDSASAKSFKRELFKNKLKLSTAKLKEMLEYDDASIETAVSKGISSGRLPEMTAAKVGDLVKIAPPAIKANQLSEATGKYVGLSPRGTPLVEVEGKLLSFEPFEIESHIAWSKKAQSADSELRERQVDRAISTLKKLLDEGHLSVEQVAQITEIAQIARRLAR